MKHQPNIWSFLSMVVLAYLCNGLEPLIGSDCVLPDVITNSTVSSDPNVFRYKNTIYSGDSGTQVWVPANVTLQAGRIVLNNFHVQTGAELHVKQCPYFFVLPKAERNPESPGGVWLTASACWWKSMSTAHDPDKTDLTYSWSMKSGNGTATFTNEDEFEGVGSGNRLGSWCQLSDATGSHAFVVTVTASDGSYNSAQCTLLDYALECPSVTICDSSTYKVTCSSTLVGSVSSSSTFNCGFLISMSKDPVLSDAAGGSATRINVTSGLNTAFTADYVPSSLGYVYYIRSFAVISANNTIYGDSLIFDTTNAVANYQAGYSLAYLQWGINGQNGFNDDNDYVPDQFDVAAPLPDDNSGRKLQVTTFLPSFQLHGLDDPVGRDQQDTGTCLAQSSLWAIDLQQYIIDLQLYGAPQSMKYSSWREMYSAITWLTQENTLDHFRKPWLEGYCFSGYGPIAGHGNAPDIDIIPYANAMVGIPPNGTAFRETIMAGFPFNASNIQVPQINCNLSVDESCEIGTNAQEIKSQVQSGHAVVIGVRLVGLRPERVAGHVFRKWMVDSSGQRISGSCAIYFPPNTLNPQQDPPVHSVAIVGWDDNFDRNRFNARDLPNGNGAWIIQQSYKPPYARYYLSYEDRFITNVSKSHPHIFNSRSDFDITRNTYPRDLLIRNDRIRTSNNGNYGKRYAMKNLVNQIDGVCERLSAIRFYTSIENESPRFHIRVNSNIGNPESGEEIGLIQASEANSGMNYRKVGFHTLNLPPISLQTSSGVRADNFIIEVESDGSDIPIMSCVPGSLLRNGQDTYTDRGYYYNGTSWSDLHDGYLVGGIPNPCKLYLKAFTESAPLQQLRPVAYPLAVASNIALVRVKPGKDVRYGMFPYIRGVWYSSSPGTAVSVVPSARVTYDDASGEDEWKIPGLTPGVSYTFGAYDNFTNGTVVDSNEEVMVMPTDDSTFQITETSENNTSGVETVYGYISGLFSNVKRAGVCMSVSLFGESSQNYDCVPSAPVSNNVQKTIADSSFPSASDSSINKWWAHFYIVLSSGTVLVSPSWSITLSPIAPGGTN